MRMVITSVCFIAIFAFPVAWVAIAKESVESKEAPKVKVVCESFPSADGVDQSWAECP